MYYKNFIQNLYFEKGDGEISIYLKENMNLISPTQEISEDDLIMIICIDIETLFKEKRGNAIHLIETFYKLNHPNLINIQKWWYIQDKMIFVETEAPLNAT